MLSSSRRKVGYIIITVTYILMRIFKIIISSRPRYGRTEFTVPNISKLFALANSTTTVANTLVYRLIKKILSQ